MPDFFEIEVKNRQTLDDIAVQEYGAMEGIYELLTDNADVLPNGLNGGLYNGLKLKIRQGEPVDEKQLAEIKRLGIEPATGLRDYPPPVGPDYNDDYNEDHYIE